MQAGETVGNGYPHLEPRHTPMNGGVNEIAKDYRFFLHS